MKAKAATLTGVPVTAQEFKAWLPAAMAAAGLSGISVSRGIGASPHLVTTFLRGADRDITATKMAKIFRFVSITAASNGVVLPVLEVAE